MRSAPEPVDGVPYWFTRLFSWWAQRRCRKHGHVYTHWESCNHCGTRPEERE